MYLTRNFPLNRCVSDETRTSVFVVRSRSAREADLFFTKREPGFVELKRNEAALGDAFKPDLSFLGSIVEGEKIRSFSLTTCYKWMILLGKTNERG